MRYALIEQSRDKSRPETKIVFTRSEAQARAYALQGIQDLRGPIRRWALVILSGWRQPAPKLLARWLLRNASASVVLTHYDALLAALVSDKAMMSPEDVAKAA